MVYVPPKPQSYSHISCQNSHFICDIPAQQKKPQPEESMLSGLKMGDKEEKTDKQHIIERSAEKREMTNGTVFSRFKCITQISAAYFVVVSKLMMLLSVLLLLRHSSLSIEYFVFCAVCVCVSLAFLPALHISYVISSSSIFLHTLGMHTHISTELFMILLKYWINLIRILVLLRVCWWTFGVFYYLLLLLLWLLFQKQHNKQTYWWQENWILAVTVHSRLCSFQKFTIYEEASKIYP